MPYPTRATASRPTSWTTSTSSSTSSSPDPADPASGSSGAAIAGRPPSARLGALGLLHPFPSALVALTTGALTLLAGGTTAQVLAATIAMAGFQASIGAANDLADRVPDATGQPWKPIPSRRIGLGAARAAAAVSLLVGIGLSALLGPGALLVGLSGYGLGLIYDLWAKRSGWGWLCLALALPLVPVYAWQAAGAGLPIQPGWLFGLGLLAGVELAIANALVDAATDPTSARGQAVGLLARLGPGRARAVMVVAGLGLIALVWGTMLGPAAADRPGSAEAGGLIALVILLVANGLVLAGLASSARADALAAWRGWHLQALGVAGTAVVWLIAVG